MKKTLLFGTFLIVSITVVAQRGNYQNMSAEERAKLQTNRMVESLELDSAIIDQAHEINLKYANQIEKARKPGASRYEMMQLMERTNNSRNKDFKKILTKDQYKKYMRQQQDIRNRMQERMGTGGGRQQQ
jgi:hypothetical protein